MLPHIVVVAIQFLSVFFPLTCRASATTYVVFKCFTSNDSYDICRFANLIIICVCFKQHMSLAFINYVISDTLQLFDSHKMLKTRVTD